MKPWMIIMLCLGTWLGSPAGAEPVAPYPSAERPLVPMKSETREEKVDDQTTRREEIIQTRQTNGAYATSERMESVIRQVSPTETRTVSEVYRIDHQGHAQPTLQITTTVTETDRGQRRVTEESRHTRGGQLVPGRQTVEVVQQTDPRTTQRSREVREPDVNQRWVLTREVAETTVQRGDGSTVTTTSVRGTDRMTGRFGETARETTTVRTQGGVTSTERVTTAPRGSRWEVQGRVITRETASTTGLVQRETIHYQKPQFAAFTRSGSEALQPEMKIVEKQVPQAGGGMKREREVYYRDVNGRWKPPTFSSDYERGRFDDLR